MIPINKINVLDEIESIDDAAEQLDNSMEVYKKKFQIKPETEFWGYCSNIHAWAEHNYDTRLLHSNLSFPLLRKLTEVGDPIAQRVFREEIAKIYESGNPTVKKFLEQEGYLKFLSKEELDSLNRK